MNANSAALLMALALAAPTINLPAQDADQPRPPRPQRFEQRDEGDLPPPRAGRPPERGPRDDGERPRGRRPDDQGPNGPRPPAPPLIGALDADRDGVIDETEIANAAAALKKLDKNGDGRLTMQELRPQPPRPPQGRNPGERQGQDGPRRSPRPENFREGDRRPDGPPPGEAPRAPRPPRPPQEDQ